MKRRFLALALTLCVLVPCVPVLSLSTHAGGSTWQTSYVADRSVTVTEDPLTYLAWAKANSGIAEDTADYDTTLNTWMNQDTNKQAYKTYYFTKGQVVWSGDWKTGGIDRTTGTFDATAYHTQFVSANWSQFGGSTWYSTRTAAEFFLDKLLKGETTQLWGFANVPFHPNVTSSHQARFSSEYTSYFSYTYTVPADRAGTLALSVLSQKTTVTATTRMCIMQNGTIIWPTGDGVKLSDSNT